ncbi:uncharacterized protein LOC133737629 [Rosa rugosa]|uniref:uncharacterized protein LOC133737629 n=1 Tax=Rosa rugosa TaxID=74645 RepID=UPI002B40A6D2|nr:uncharacterized protein LOC133737629 [Rosa rugosa]
MAYHTRSNSFPSRPHPVNQEVDEYLSRLRSSETTSVGKINRMEITTPTTKEQSLFISFHFHLFSFCFHLPCFLQHAFPFCLPLSLSCFLSLPPTFFFLQLRRDGPTTSTSSISHRLSGLQDLHDCVDRLLQLPLTQQSLAKEKHQKWADEILDGSLRMLDVCSTAKDAMLQTKECIQELQSIIRRRRKDQSGVVTSEVRKYLTLRKTVKKAIQKALGNLKANRSTFSSLNNDQETISIFSKLRDVEVVTLTVLESVLSFISGPKSKPSSWSLVSKMVQSKRIACKEEMKVNEFALVDAALKSHKSLDDAHNQLNNLNSCIQDQEEGLDCLFRQLIKTRVSLLNILSH